MNFSQILHRPPDLRRRAVGPHLHSPACSRCAHADQRVPGSRAAVGRRSRAVSRRQPEGDRRNRRRAARARDQRRREHALHVVAGDDRRRADAHRHLQLGTDIDNAQVQVQNRVPQALPRLPEEVRAPRRHDDQELARPHDGRAPGLARRPLRRRLPAQLRHAAGARTCSRACPASGTCSVFGAGDYAMRVWLDPQQGRRARISPPATSSRAIREQNVQVAAGSVGAAARRRPSSSSSRSTRKGRLVRRRGVRRHRRQDRRERRSRRGCATSRASSSAPATTRCARCSTTRRRSPFRSSRRRARTRSNSPTTCAPTMEELKKSFPQGMDYDIVYDPTRSCASRSTRWSTRCSRRSLLVVLVVILFLQTWRASIIPLVAVPVSLVGTFAVMLALGFSHQHAVAVRPGAGDRHRGRRRHRRGRERRAPHRARAHAARGDARRR